MQSLPEYGFGVLPPYTTVVLIEFVDVDENTRLVGMLCLHFDCRATWLNATMPDYFWHFLVVLVVHWYR